jgi:hypothetical protein
MQCWVAFNIYATVWHARYMKSRTLCIPLRTNNWLNSFYWVQFSGFCIKGKPLPVCGRRKCYPTTALCTKNRQPSSSFYLSASVLACIYRKLRHQQGTVHGLVRKLASRYVFKDKRHIRETPNYCEMGNCSHWICESRVWTIKRISSGYYSPLLNSSELDSRQMLRWG